MTPLARLAGGRKSLLLNLASEPEHDADGWFYPTSTSGGGDKEPIEASFDGYVAGAFKSNPVVFTCAQARAMPFSEARFQYQTLTSGRPGKLFGTPALTLLERPWPNGTTGELLIRMMQDGDLAGNFYATTVGEGANRRIRRLRPDWVTILSGIRGGPPGTAYELDAEVLGYFYSPGGRADKTVLLTPERVVHWSPIPDPEAQWRGMSWLTPVLREIQADTYATRHKLRFFEKGAMLNVIIKYDKELKPDVLQRYVALFDEAHGGVGNAYKTLHLGGGADATVIGTDLKQIDFKSVQGGGETRIAAAAGVGAIIARFSEGLAGSSLNAGNYSAAKRQFADMTLRPLWRTAAGSLEKLVPPIQPARLWYDTRDIEFLKEDRKDAADIRQIEATTMTALIREGFTAESVVAYMETDDRTQLEHSGLTSVQLQAPGDSEGGASPTDIAALLQKIYLAVAAGVVTVEEAREIANRAGAGLGPELPPLPAMPVVQEIEP